MVETNSPEALYRTLKDDIARGTYLRGARLPTEAALCTRHGLGRGAVRKAIALLRDEGLVVTRQGSGAYVCRHPETGDDAPRRIASKADLDLLFEYRTAIERESAWQAATRRSEADLVALEARVARLHDAISADGMGESEDFDLHAEIAHSSGNPFLLSGVLALRTDILFTAQRRAAITIISAQERLALVETEHAAILSSIQAGDAARAADAMADHIAESHKRLRSGAV